MTQTLSPEVKTRVLEQRTLAVLFPGQGSQVVGMARELATHVPEAASVFDLADKILGRDTRMLCWKSSSDELRATENAQPALVISALACWSAFRARNPFALHSDSVFAGHSLGALTAAAAAGYVSFGDALLLSAARGRLMASASGHGAMLAVSVPPLGRVEQQFEVAQELAHRFDLDVAALNGPKQVVLSGESERIAHAQGVLGGICRELLVSHAFHSRLMLPVVPEWIDLVRSVAWTQGANTYVPNGAARATSDVDVVRVDLEQALHNPVRWSSVLEQAPPDAHAVVPGSGQSIVRLLRGTSLTKVSPVDTMRSLLRAVAA